jgi:hypothetical protein
LQNNRPDRIWGAGGPFLILRNADPTVVRKSTIG